MGYMTNFRLSVHKSDKKTTVMNIVDYMLERQKENANIFYLFDSDIKDVKRVPNYFGDCIDLKMSCNHAKWYYHDDDMLELSLTFPDIIFKLHGEGEVTDDIWDAYYKNGKKVIYEAEIVIPSLNEDDLK